MSHCHVCLVEKDMNVKEVYPYPEDERLITEPIEPLLQLDVQPFLVENEKHDWRSVMVCHACFKRLDPDMWISDECLVKVGCKTPYDQLPLMED